LASDEMPDIALTWGSGITFKTMKKASTEGMAAELTESIAKYGENVAYWLNNPDLSMQMKNDLAAVNTNGKTYCLPTGFTTEPGISGWGFYIRKDIAEAIDVKTDGTALTTTDSLISMFQKIDAGNFTDINGKKVYAFGCNQDWSARPLFVPFNFGSMYNDLCIIEGKVDCWMLTEHAKQQIAFVKKLLSEGYMDPESFTQNYEGGQEKAAQGKYATIGFYKEAATATGSAAIRSLIETNPEMAYIPLGNMNNIKGTNETVINYGAYTALSLWVSKKADVDAVIKLLNYTSSKEGRALTQYGTSDMYSVNENDEITWTDAFQAEYTADPTAFGLKYGTGYVYSLGPNFSYYTTNQYAKFNKYIYAIPKNDFSKECEDITAIISPNVTYANKLNISSLLNSFSGYDTLNPIMNTKYDILIQCYLSSSVEKANSLWDDYVGDLKNGGIEDLIAYAQAEYDKNPDMYTGFENQ